MIRVVFAERPEQLLFTCDGHAGGDKGSDIVCAAVSTAVELMQRMLASDVSTWANGAVQMEVNRPHVRPHEQEAYMWWSKKRSDWGVFRQFFVDLAEKYPDRVSVATV